MLIDVVVFFGTYFGDGRGIIIGAGTNNRYDGEASVNTWIPDKYGNGGASTSYDSPELSEFSKC